MPAPDFETIYDLDQNEDTFKAILAPFAMRYGAIVYGKRTAMAANTPFVELNFLTQQYDDQREVALFPQYNGQDGSGIIKPRNIWAFELSCTINTNRATNGNVHRKLVAIMRCQLNFHRLLSTWNETTAPYYNLIFTEEQPETVESFDPDNVDTTTIVFAGKVQVKRNAWPIQ